MKRYTILVIDSRLVEPVENDDGALSYDAPVTTNKAQADYAASVLDSFFRYMTDEYRTARVAELNSK